MDNLPTRKPIRIPQYDYSAPGAYFVTVCTADKSRILWEEAVGAAICRPRDEIPLSAVGKLVEQGILQIPQHYDAVCVDKYCVMPDHIHLILRIRTDENGRQVAAPTVSTVVGSMKRWVTRQVGRPIWQKSFYEHAIRGTEDYDNIWQYIENNPLKYVLKTQNQPW